MTDFSSAITTWTQTVHTRVQDVFLGTVSEATRSIVEGSPITGAPGQPVDTGNLRASWQTTFESPTSALIATNVAYAPYVEDNVRNVTYRNHGPHSVKLTRAGLPRIVESETAKVAR